MHTRSRQERGETRLREDGLARILEARSLPTTLLGTSGWSYRDWEGVLYPARETPKLAFYSRYFRTAEIDATFYDYPTKAMIQACSRMTPDNFSFSARVPRLVTHDRRLDVREGAGRDLMHFLSDLRGLEEDGKLGPLVFQLPRNFGYKDGLGRLIDFFGALPSDVKFAVEFTNSSWYRPETWDLLRQCRIANVIVDAPGLPVDPVVTTDFAVIRWHGRGKETWSDYRYTDAEMDDWAQRTRDIGKEVGEVFGYFCNHTSGQAVEDCLRLMERLGLADADQIEKRAEVGRAIGVRKARRGLRGKDEAGKTL